MFKMQLIWKFLRRILQEPLTPAWQLPRMLTSVILYWKFGMFNNWSVEFEFYRKMFAVKCPWGKCCKIFESLCSALHIEYSIQRFNILALCVGTFLKMEYSCSTAIKCLALCVSFNFLMTKATKNAQDCRFVTLQRNDWKRWKQMQIAKTTNTGKSKSCWMFKDIDEDS